MNHIFQIIFWYTQYTACLLFWGILGKNVVFWGCINLANYLFQPWLMFILYDNGVLIWKFLLIICSRCSLIRRYAEGMPECTCHSSFGLKTKDSRQTKLICFFFVFFKLRQSKDTSSRFHVQRRRLWRILFTWSKPIKANWIKSQIVIEAVPLVTLIVQTSSGLTTEFSCVELWLDIF